MIKRLFSFLLVLPLLLAACSDGDSFSTDASHRLLFTADTVRMDTLFATIPSSTYSFWVHNESGSGLRLRTVRLERGGQSGFRVNVDGSFLNPVVNNLEVRDGDSLRVFVEIPRPAARRGQPPLHPGEWGRAARQPAHLQLERPPVARRQRQL